MLLYRVPVPSVAHHLGGFYTSLEKAFCDKEMAETEAKKADNEADIEKLSTKIDSMTAKSSKLKGQVAALQAELAALARTQAEADRLRAEEKSAFDTNSAEMDKGVKGVQLALKVLREYYAKDAAHSSADGAGAGIIGLLEAAWWPWGCIRNSPSPNLTHPKVT